MIIGRYESGYWKFQKKRRVELFVGSQKGAMNEFININKKMN